MFKWLVKWIIKLAKRTPYTHIHDADGSLYMERYWLMPKWMLNEFYEHHSSGQTVVWYEPKWRMLTPRAHYIAREDRDRHLHDHPWHFISIVLRNWYQERRPETIEPCFSHDKERGAVTLRKTGSIAFRRATDRHMITTVSPGGCWTLVILWPKVQWWGFYTPRGKVYWKDYDKYKQWASERWMPR